LKVIDKSEDDCLIQIQSLCKDLHAIVDRLEQNTISEMKSRKTSLGNQIQADVDKIDDVTEKLQKLLGACKDGGDTNEALSYVGFTKCHEMIFNAQLLLQNIANKDDFKMSFEPFKEIKEYLSSLEMLGDVICDGGEKLYQVETHVLHNIKVQNDRKTCRIAEICRIASGEFLLSDSNNSKLKLVSNIFKVISTLDVPNFPNEVTSTGQHDAAVAVDNRIDKGEILLVRVKAARINHTRTIKLRHRCIGLVHHNDNLYVSDSTTLHVYDIAGGQGRQLYSDRTGWSTVNSCAVSPDGSQLIITAQSEHQLITLNKDGTKLSTLTHPELIQPYFDHFTPQGHLFLCCNASVMQVMERGVKKTVKTLAGTNNYLTKPESLFFNSSNSTLIIGHNNNNIVELKLK